MKTALVFWNLLCELKKVASLQAPQPCWWSILFVTIYHSKLACGTLLEGRVRFWFLITKSSYVLIWHLEHDLVLLVLMKVGSGYSKKQLKEFNEKLAQYWQVYDKKNPPRYLELASGFKEKPDAWLPPEKSHILQVCTGSFFFTKTLF